MTAMKKHVWFLGIIMMSLHAFAQNSLRIQIKDSSNKVSLPNVSVMVDGEGKTTDSNVPLTPKNRFASVIARELSEKIQIRH